MLMIYFAKRVAIVVALILIIAPFLGAFTSLFVAGLVGGAILSLYKIRSYQSLLQGMVGGGNGKKTMLHTCLSQVLSFIVLAVSIQAGLLCFAGMAAGLLSVPAVILAGALTGRLKPEKLMAVEGQPIKE